MYELPNARAEYLEKDYTEPHFKQTKMSPYMEILLQNENYLKEAFNNANTDETRFNFYNDKKVLAVAMLVVDRLAYDEDRYFLTTEAEELVAKQLIYRWWEQIRSHVNCMSRDDIRDVETHSELYSDFIVSLCWSNHISNLYVLIRLATNKLPDCMIERNHPERTEEKK